MSPELAVNLAALVLSLPLLAWGVRWHWQEVRRTRRALAEARAELERTRVALSEARRLREGGGG